MKYKTVIYSTVRAEIHHDEEFVGKKDALNQIMECELLDYGSILGGQDLYGGLRVTSIEIVEDEVHDFNLEADEEYADE
jgi:hypothetical protein